MNKECGLVANYCLQVHSLSQSDSKTWNRNHLDFVVVVILFITNWWLKYDVSCIDWNFSVAASSPPKCYIFFLETSIFSCQNHHQSHSSWWILYVLYPFRHSVYFKHSKKSNMFTLLTYISYHRKSDKVFMLFMVCK